ncbi:uncharacterized protein EV420DRAFT_1648457 [Desarmillaria tabescens]|uniref:Uncharacterized protein n=1 Tax=Armillaria tabescens TaxID=1929756 RepID=A0AA39MTK7_ARMTA|nr:uncharacterized protein EV420DRAFT_1648457 [Desarmillaria tabescens]KAK0445325.1 hypothetical protein EV420DRAFT_1648457 [Desarmillaria tabescens]
MQCKSLIAALLALTIAFASAAPIPDVPGGVDEDVEPDVGQTLLHVIDLSMRPTHDTSNSSLPPKMSCPIRNTVFPLNMIIPASLIRLAPAAPVRLSVT